MIPRRLHRYQFILLFLSVAIALLAAGCNLGPVDSESALTPEPTSVSAEPTRTLLPEGALPTPGITTATPTPTVVASTPIISFPTARPPIVIPTFTQLPVSIVILSPVPGNIASGNVQILGSAVHPSFLQYRLEFGPDPNPNNLWFPITSLVQSPVLNSTLGIWNTNSPGSPDGVYQLRLRVFLRDGRQEITTVGNIRIRNQAPTPIPSNTPNIPRPIASFSQDRTSGDAPLVVRFINQSQGQINSFAWDFGDGGNSNAINPIHTFQSPGVYTVTLRVTGPGGTANVSRQFNVTSPSAPIAGFQPSVVSGPAPLTVTFNNTSTGNFTSSSWNFGDNETSSERNPTHTFNTVGTFNVILEIRGPGGTSRTVRQITVENPQIPPPQASFQADQTSGLVPLTVTFSNTTTGEVTQYLWDFNGDGITDSIDTDPTHTFTQSGNYTARLTAIGPGGQASTDVQIDVQQPPDSPTAAFAVQPSSGEAPLTVNFSNQTVGDVTSYEWDFDSDGTVDSTDANPQHTYNNPGTYTAVLRANGPGGSTTADAIVNVTTPLQPPTARFEANPTSGQVPLLVQFTNTSEGSELEFAWDFNDDGIVDSTESNPSFEYTSTGTYTVTLNANNRAGTSDATATINVEEEPVIPPPTAAFAAQPDSGDAPLTVTFSNQTVGDITRYEWDFTSDGTVDSTDANPQHTYDDPGSYVVTLRAFGPGGETSTTATITVDQPIPAPEAAFSAQPDSGDAPLTVTFSNQTTGDVTSYEWDFTSDGTVDSTDANPQHTYDDPGSYVATLRAFGPGGETSTTATITVDQLIPAPEAAFSAQPDSGDAPLTVTFSNQTTGDVTSYEWDFTSDGTVDSTDANPQHTYDDPGNYVATLRAFGPGGETSTTATITVTAPAVPPVVSFEAQPSSGTAPLSVTLTILTDPATYTAFTWDFNNDGVPDNTTDNPATATYNEPGDYTITLTLENNGVTASESQMITVLPPLEPPVANFMAEPTMGTAPLTVTFTNTSTGTVESFAWDVNGDGIPENTTDDPFVFTYDTPGTYNATLTVNGADTSNSISQEITVEAPAEPPSASFTADIETGEAPLTVTFTNTSTGTVESFAWDVNGDGIPENTTDDPFVFTYDTPGTYNATLTVNGADTSSTASQTITVTEPAPTAPTGPLAYVSNISGNNEIYIANADGSNPVNVTNNPGNDTDPAWSPDGARLLFVSDRSGNNEIYVLDVASLNVTQLTNHPASDIQPAWSPDGSRIAFASDREGDMDIYIMGSDGANPVSLTAETSDDRHPTWSRNSDQLAFQSDRAGDSGTYNIFIVNISDPNQVLQVTTESNNTQPAWSPNGASIAFVKELNGDADVYIMQPDGTNHQSIASGPGTDTSPAWLPDSSQLVIVSDRFGDPDIFLVPATPDAPATQLTSDTSAETAPSWRSLSR